MPNELSDDMADWPADPFALLGVRPGASDTDIKRAYTRLIRRFKPEHAPDQFRRVREAYEACLQRARWYRPDPEPDRTPDPTAPEPAAELPRPAPVVDEADRLWDVAVAGDEPEAYRGLVELARGQPDRAELPVRLYWLLALNPSLDPDRTRHDWLFEALDRGRLRGPAAELYRRELDADPGRALAAPYRTLLTRPADAGDVLLVARWRAAAAGRANDLAAVANDLESVRGRAPADDEGGWLALLVAVFDQAAWAPKGAVDQIVRAELGRLRHLELSHTYHFDRLDETAHVAAAWRAAAGANVWPQILAVVRAAWAGYGDVRRTDAAAAAAAVAGDPGRALGEFGRLVGGKGPGLVNLFSGAFERLVRAAGGYDPAFPPELLRGLIRSTPAARRFSDMPHSAKARGDMLALLSAEAVDPLELAAACDFDPDPRYRRLADHLRADAALRAVWLADRVHRG